MNINDLENFRLSDAVKFHNTLNPDLFTDERMQADVRKQLLAIAEDFVEFMGVDTIKVVDIRLYGSSAAYTYTKHSDIDLHVLVDMSDIEDDEVYSELFNSKKRLYNDNLDITVRGLPVELYMQDAKEEVKSLGDYSILNGRWVKFPKRAKASLEEHSVKEKFKRLIVLSELALRSSDIDLLDGLLDTLRRYRQSGLEEGGEFSPENIAYKALRSKGIVDKLYKHRDVLHSDDLSIDEDVYETQDIPDLHETRLMSELKQFMESSGYIPSEGERDDPRFKTALSIDIDPHIMPRQAKVMGLGTINRDGRPQQLQPSGKFTR
jgi:predicted nucleotidyltransferase